MRGLDTKLGTIKMLSNFLPDIYFFREEPKMVKFPLQV